MIHPFLVIKIPFYGLLDTLLKLERWLPAEFLLQLSRVNSITHIVTLSVCYISDEIQILAFLSAEQTVNGLDNHLDDIDVLPLVETADVVSLGNLTLVENHIDEMDINRNTLPSFIMIIYKEIYIYLPELQIIEILNSFIKQLTFILRDYTAFVKRVIFIKEYICFFLACSRDFSR